MRILQIISSLDPKSGGPLENLRQISFILSKYGHEVEIVTFDEENTRWAKDIMAKVYFLGPAYLNYRYCPKFTNWLKKNINKYDAVIIRGLWQFHGFATWRVVRKTKIPYFVFPHGMLDPWFKYKYPLKHIKKMLYWPWAEYKVLRDARAVMFTSEQEAILAEKSFKPYKINGVVIRYGTSLPPQDKDEKKDLFFKRYPYLASKKIILFMGRIHPKKGCDLLIKAFAELVKKEENTCLVIAGPDQGGWTDKLRGLSKKLDVYDKIVFTGMLSGDLKWGAFYSADIFILPSHQENFGIVVAEALGCGCPVLMTNKINIWNTVEKYEAGFVAGDSQEGINILLNNWLKLSDQEKEKMRVNAKKCFEENFEISESAKNMIDIFKRYNVGEKNGRCP